MSADLDNQIKDAYAEFWQKRDAEKKRLREELEKNTAAARQALSQVLWSARRSTEKYTVQDIADLLGLSNRNFLYSVMNDQPINPATNTVGRPSSASKTKKADKEKSAPFHLRADVDYNGRMGAVFVVVRDASNGSHFEYTLDIEPDDGTIVEIPEDWFVDTLTPDEVQFYKDLIKRIESGE